MEKRDGESNFLDETLNSIEDSAALLSAPEDRKLRARAEEKYPHDPSEQMAEYNRLMLAKLRAPRRGFWSRLFGQ